MAFERFVGVGCTHGDLIDPQASKKFFQFLKSEKFKHRFHLGDVYDFRALRRGADPREEGDSLDDDLVAGDRFQDDFRPTVLLGGNHDWGRLASAMRNWRGTTRAYAKGLMEEWQERCDKNGTLLVPYNSLLGAYKFGDTTLIHGYHAGADAAKQHARIYRKCLFAHLHRVEHATVPGLDDATAQCIGSLADFRSMEYASQRTATLAWRAAWVHGVINTKTGKVKWWMVEDDGDGNFITPTGIKII